MLQALCPEQTLNPLLELLPQLNAEKPQGTVANTTLKRTYSMQTAKSEEDTRQLYICAILG